MSKYEWDQRFMQLASLVSRWSEDRSRKAGCVLVGAGHEVLAIGFNGFPRGVKANVEIRHQRPDKYRWTEHAERNALYNAARVGVSTEGATAYLQWFPCMDCARALIQGGVKVLKCVEPDWKDSIWQDDFRDVPTMLNEGGVAVEYVDIHDRWKLP